MRLTYNTVVCVIVLSITQCSPKKQESDVGILQPEKAPILWHTRATVISDAGDSDYHGYSRVIALSDDRWMLTYFDAGTTAGGGIMARYSSDSGATWSIPEVVHQNTAQHEYNNPEPIELSDGTIMVVTNLRPVQPGRADHFEIGLIKKPVGGVWSEVEILYRADTEFHNGCWEPKMIELPDGSLEIYFANEANFRNNNDQEISKLYSQDKGKTWTGPVRFAYSEGARDGMPVSILLKGEPSKTLTAIEDNSKGGRFTISILESPAIAGAPAAERLHGVVPNEMADKSIYCGAPYLATLPNGGLILTGQTDYKRIKQDDPLHISVPFVAVCEPNSYGKFQLVDANPFGIASQHEGLWNSVAVIGNTVLLLTSTQDDNGQFKVKMKKGTFNDVP